MRVYIIPTKAPPHPHDTDESDVLRNLQTLVGGFIEPCAPVQLKQQGIELLADEEGLLKQLPCNENLFPFFFVGPLVAVGIGDEDFVSLTPDQEEYLRMWLEGLN